MAYDYNAAEGTSSRRPRVRFSGDYYDNQLSDEPQPPVIVRPSRYDSIDSSGVRPRRRDSDDEYRSRRPVHVQAHSRPWNQQGGAWPAVYREAVRPMPVGSRRVVPPRDVRVAEPQSYLQREVDDIQVRHRSRSSSPSPPHMPLSQSPPPMVDEARVETAGANHAWRRAAAAAEPEWHYADPYRSRNRSRCRSRSRSRSPNRYRNDYVFGGTPAPAYKSGDADVYIVPENQYLSHRPFRPPTLVGEDTDLFDSFNFSFPPAESSEEGELSDLESPGVEAESTQRDDEAGVKNSNATGIYSSHYTGNAELGGTHTATLTVLHDPKGQKRPLFNWLHIRQEVMNFDEFWADVSRQVRFSEAERTAIAKIRADVKKHSVKSRQNPKGSKVGYMDPRWFEVPLKSAKKKLTPGYVSPGSARWVCIPYFSLQQYSGLLSASNLASFPPQTLLQAQYSRTPQPRDMEQAVCQLGTVRRGECFHIAQLWCLVLDNSLLVTCGSMSQSDLYGDSLKLNSQPSKQPTGASGSGRILVVHGSAVMWDLNAEDCLTWFAFLSHFHAFWPRNLEFKSNDQVVTAEMWPRILKLAARPQGSVILSFKTISRPEPPKSVLKPESPGETKTEGCAKESDQSPEYLHVLTLRPSDSRASADASPTAVLESLKVQLEAAEKFLTEHNSYAGQRAYKGCGRAMRGDVYSYLANQAAEVEAKASDTVRRLYEDRIDIFNTADDLFQLFFPKDFDGPTVGEFWASVKSAVVMPNIDSNPTSPVSPIVLSELKAILKSMSQEIQAFQSILSYADEKELANVDLPREFVTAWLHVVSGMIATSGAVGIWLMHLSKARALMVDGMQRVIQGTSSRSLLDSAAVLPMEVMFLIAMELLQDQVGKADDIADTYSQFLNSLDTDITTKPSDRSYQHRVELVQQEMTAIKRTLAKQRLIMASIRSNLSAVDSQELLTGAGDDGLWRRRNKRDAATGWDHPAYRETAHYYPTYEAVARRTANDYMWLDDQMVDDLEAASKLSPTDGLGFRGLLVMECARLIEQREFEFRRYTEYAEDLERAVVYKMDWTKDRQENAIYAFTVVTIVFLPLSAISSVFGMNTADVRNMDFGQWLYWAVALPVTLIVIVVGLWWMNELGNVVQWMMGRQPGRATGGGGLALQVPDKKTTFLVAPPAAKADSDYEAPYAEVQEVPMGRYSSEPPAVMPRIRRRPRSVYRY
ncbi:hypothetical protein TOPH_05226 [Tolypocladium ophioglossoides CBS 100239]|uniref:Magnesium transport protein CorA n=1 Tax=Tolypocladium ophioglossoides (strain CBS 100239) TaxID=1163406 RepID=A0A0L0N8K5_TOLOC|nr:hypothetical protein TOPH_05226 [Tolypocladium ophioglossoides CBS 100239]